jgi:hypothetical protein
MKAERSVIAADEVDAAFGVTEKGMVGRTVDLIVEAVAQPA